VVGLCRNPENRAPASRVCSALISGLWLASILLGSPAARAQPAAYAGKQITILVSSAPGGGYDAISRTVGRHLGRHLPGTPSIVLQNMLGAGGVVAANHLYNIAPKDGLVLAQLQNTVPFEPLYGNKQARYEPPRFNWLGSPSRETALLIVWHTSPIQKLADATRNEIILGATGASSTPAFYARLLADVFGLKVKLISGYPGQNEQFLAMEKGENDGGPSTFLSSLKVMRPGWMAESRIRFLLQYALVPSPELKDVPFALDLLRDRPAERKLMEIASAPLALGRPFAAPPDVPPAQLGALRKAFIQTFSDREFLADCNRQQLECDSPSSGEEIQKIVADAYAAAPEIIARIQKIYGSRL
jgi:tripartite-type tricarboxylate transporter receptor subunit TctC